MEYKYGAPNANGHRRRELTRRIKARSTHCALCTAPLNPEARYPAPDATVIDENIPRARGGSPLDPNNTHAMHNHCNRWKSTMTLTEAHQLLQLGASLDKPLTKHQIRTLLAKPHSTWQPAANRWK